MNTLRRQRPIFTGIVMVIGIGPNGDAAATPVRMHRQGASPRSGLNGEQVVLCHRGSSDQSPSFAPVGHQREAGVGSRKGLSRTDPVGAAGLECIQERMAVTLHVCSEIVSNSRVGTDGAFKVVMPVIAMKRPVEHHQTTGKAAVGDRFLETKGDSAGFKGRWEAVLVATNGAVSVQLPHHHPCGRLDRLIAKEGFALQPLSAGCTGFCPRLLAFPPPSKRLIGCGQQITQVAAINEHLCRNAARTIRSLNV